METNQQEQNNPFTEQLDLARTLRDGILTKDEFSERVSDIPGLVKKLENSGEKELANKVSEIFGLPTVVPTNFDGINPFYKIKE